MSQTDSSQAFVIHTRPFKETSLIVEIFSQEFGRLSLVARGARSATKKSQKRALLQPFYPLEVSWFGRSNLKSLKQLESMGLPIPLKGLSNLCGLYLNELILKLLIQWDPHPELFDSYVKTLQQLDGTDSPQIVLREFERYFLDELGYGVDWSADIYGEWIEPDQIYTYIPQQGFVLENQHDAIFRVKGELILAVSESNWQVSGALSLARKVAKNTIDILLDGKELNSRKLLQQTLALQS